MLIKILNETIHTQNKWCSILSKDKVDLAHLSVFSTNVNFDKFYSVSKLPKKMKQSHLHNTLYTTLPGKKKKEKEEEERKKVWFSYLGNRGFHNGSSWSFQFPQNVQKHLIKF